VFFFEKKNQKTFIYLAFTSGRSVFLDCHAKKIPNAIPLALFLSLRLLPSKSLVLR
jgi:hypothetical protein